MSQYWFKPKRYDELAGPKYTDRGAIFDIMAVTVIENQWATSPQA